MAENAQQTTGKERMISLGYVTGLSLILAAIIYFFAANWSGFDKWEKISLSIGMIVLFYSSSFLLSKLFWRRPFVSELFLFGGCITFGVSVALLGQIYNSHADSFMLFAVWAVPSLLLSFVTNYQPFYVLTYGLIHLAVWLFLFPSSGFQMDDEYWYRSFFIGTAIANSLLFFAIEKRIFRSKWLSVLSFIVFHVTMLIVTTGEWLELFPSVMSAVYLIVFVFWFRHDLKKGEQKWVTLLLGLALTVFVIIKFIAFLIFFDSEFIFFLTFFFPIVLVAAAVWALNKWGSRLKTNAWLKRIVVGIIAAVASVMGASSIAGILFITIGEVPFYIMTLLAVCALILPAVLNKGWDKVIRHTLLLTGYLMGVSSALLSHFIVACLFIAVMGLVFFMYESKTMKYFTYFAAMMTLTGSLAEIWMEMEGVVLFLLVLNAVVFAACRFLEEQHRIVLAHNSYVYAFLSFFILTFLNEQSALFYFTVNILYILLATVVMFYTAKQEQVFEHRTVMLFWFAYIVYKYYDLLWSLLHKSITFVIAGALLLWLTKRYDRLMITEGAAMSFIRRKWLPILAVIAVQFLIIGGQIGKSEALLADGKEIQLKLAPVDPRSLLQGDYVILRYSISTIELEPEPAMNEKVSIGLVKNEDGVYDYNGSFITGKANEASSLKADVWMTGRYKGAGRIEYGIENYFVSEGTGLEVEQSATYANVKVSKSGDAILLSLE